MAARILSLLALVYLPAPLALADRVPLPEEQVFARASVIVDVSVSRVDAKGYVSLQPHEYVRGAGIPGKIKVRETRRKDSGISIGALAGGRYLLFEVRERLYPEEVYRLRSTENDRREVQYQDTWISFDDFKKRIPEPLRAGERNPRKVLAAISVFGPEAVSQADGSLSSNLAFMRVAARLAPGAFQYASAEIRGDRALMLAAISDYPAAHGLSSLWKDRNFVLEASRLTRDAVTAGFVPLNFTILGNASPALQNDRDLVLDIVRHNGRELRYASERLRSDRAVAEASGGAGLPYADPALLNDRELVLKLVAQDGNALIAASYRLKLDRELVLAAVSSRGDVLGQLPEKFRADREVVLAAVASYGDSLILADEALRDDREVVLAAVRNRPQALGWASNGMRSDPKIAMEAVRGWGYAIQYLDPSNPGMTSIALEALRQEPNSYSHLPYALLEDPAFLRAAVPLSPRIVGYLPNIIRQNEALYKELLLTALDKDEAALAGAPGFMLDDADFILQAGRKSFYALAYAQGRAAQDPRLLAMKDDRERVEQAIRKGSRYALGAASVRLQTDPDLIKKAAASSKFDLKLHPSVWKDRNVVMDLLKGVPQLLAGAPWIVRSDKEMALIAVGKDGAVFSAVDRVLREDPKVVLAALRSRPELADQTLSLARGGVQWDDDVRKYTEKNPSRSKR